jgi:hypothetical protein
MGNESERKKNKIRFKKVRENIFSKVCEKTKKSISLKTTHQYLYIL